MNQALARRVEMRNYKNGLLVIMVMAVVLIAAMTALRGQSQRQSQEDLKKKDDATPIKEGVLTERQKQHGKLFERPGGTNLRKTGKSLNIIATVPFMEPDSEKTPASTEELLLHLTCNADAIVIGTATGKSSQLTEDGSFVFTDYDVQVEEVVRDSASGGVKGGDSIVITRPGGAVEFSGKTIRVKDKSFKPLEVGGRFLLFLRRISSSGAYRAVNSEGSFELEQNRVRRLTAKQLPYPFIYEDDATSLLARVRAAGSLCDSQAKGEPR